MAHSLVNCVNPCAAQVVLQPVESVRVLPWWNQDYYTVSCPDMDPSDDCDKEDMATDMW